MDTPDFASRVNSFTFIELTSIFGHMKYTYLLLLGLIACSTAFAQQEESFDYWAENRKMISHGVQAILTCNGLFTSNRTLEQVYDQELKYLKNPLGTPAGGPYEIDWDRKAVAIGSEENGPVMRAAFREGIGCIIMAPDQSFDDISSLPEQKLAPLDSDTSNLPWPMGDQTVANISFRELDSKKLQEASDWAFNRESEEQVTLSLLIIYKGQIVHERYAEGIDITTKTRTWSTEKSIAATLVGILVDEGKMKLDESLGFEWLPEAPKPGKDPRNQITLRDALQMSSGLYPVDNSGMEYATGSGMAYWAGASSSKGARNRALIREPGTVWDYENYDCLLAVMGMRKALGDDKTYHEFPRKALFDKIGMHNTFASTDRFGDFIFSSQVYTNARDLGRFGLLYLNRGNWNGEQIVSEEWIDFVTSPAPSTSETGNFYGGQWWLVPDDRTDVPKTAYSTAGNRGQYTIVVPSHDLVVVRRGLDYGKQGFDRWDLTREVLKAIKE